MSKAGAHPVSVRQSTSAVIKCADKASNKPKPSEFITDFYVWHEDWWLLDNSHTNALWIVLCSASFKMEDNTTLNGLVCLFWYSLLFSKANGLENLTGLVKFLMAIWALSLSFFLFTDLSYLEISLNLVPFYCIYQMEYATLFIAETLTVL